MPYSDRDAQIAPPTEPTSSIDWQTLCDAADGTQDVMIAYAFGGGAPTTVELGSELMMSSLQGYRRMFVEYYATGWNPNSPDYTGS